MTVMARRRHFFAATAGALVAVGVGVAARAQGKQLTLRSTATPESMAQLAAGGPTGLLGVSAPGRLWALSPQGGPARLLGQALDAATPLANGHGRLAARRKDGRLWVLEEERSATSAGLSLAPAAGLLNLPLAVIAIEAGAQGQQVVRLEAAGVGAERWRVTARSEMAVLPDARPLQADLDGAGDDGHVVVLAGPDRERYRHGVLGDEIEATRLVLLERHSLRLMRELTLGLPYVFEDIAPRRVALGARDGLLTVQSGPQGAQLVLVAADPTAPTALRIAASGPALGSVNRWLSPIAGAEVWLAVHTPHIGGVLHAYQWEGNRLVPQRLLEGVSNHHIGSRQLNVSTWQGKRLLVAEQSGRRLLLLDPASSWRVACDQVLPSRVLAMVGLGAADGTALLLEDGNVTVALC